MTANEKLINGPSLPSNPTEGANWIIICRVGFVWADGISPKIINCTNQGNWSYNPDPCVGTVINLYMFVHMKKYIITLLLALLDNQTFTIICSFPTWQFNEWIVFN